MSEILSNSKARRDYHILETFEAGIVLHGTEVKSLRAGRGQLSDAFARVEKDEIFLHNAHIDEYAMGNRQNHLPKSVRKLLLHKSEIRKLFGLGSVKGNAIFPGHPNNAVVHPLVIPIEYRMSIHKMFCNGGDFFG